MQEDLESRIHRVEATVVDLPMGENQAPLRMDLLQLMKLYNVPGLSIAVIENYKMVWAKGYGVIETGSSKPVTASRWRRQVRFTSSNTESW